MRPSDAAMRFVRAIARLLRQALWFTLHVRSLRYTLMFWYVGVLTVILCVFGWSLYSSVRGNLNRDINRGLAQQADRVADTIATFWEAQRSMQGAGPGNWATAPSDTLVALVNAGGLPALVDRWNEKTGVLNTGYLLRVLDDHGRRLAETAEFQRLEIDVANAAVLQANRGEDVYDTLTRGDGRFRLLTHPVVGGGRVLYLVQTAASLHQADVALLQLRFWLFWLIPVTLLVTSLVGAHLANRALQPLNDMVTQARQIVAERLVRITVPRTGDELERLAVTFNEMLDRIERAFHRLRQFSAAASHELRTPLTVMKGELEVALRKARSPEEYRWVLQTHLEAINELVHIVGELLTLARSEAAVGALEWSPVDLCALVKRTCDTWQKPAEAKQVRVDMPADGPVWVRGEQRLLERLVGNLLDNAIRYTPPNGLVTVQADRQGEEACLRVRDEGPGIPQEELPHVFDRFFRQPSPTDGTHSTGLGLGLCRWITEVHHGRIDVQSQAQHGTTVTVWLPLDIHPC